MNTIKIYTDGACRGNQNDNANGGYGAVILDGDNRIELSQGYADTTNNRMELRAVIAGLKAIEQPSNIEVISDSKYIVNAFNEDWIAGWIKRGWKTSSKTPVVNRDLWEELIPLDEKHDVTWTWVKGHSGNAENERADELACAAADSGELIKDNGSTDISHAQIIPEDSDTNQEKGLDKGRMIRLTGLSVLQAMKERAEEILAPELTGAFVEDGFADDGTYCLTCGFDERDEKRGPGEHSSVVFNASVIWGGANG